MPITQPPAPEESRDPTDGIPWNQLTPRQNLERKASLARSAMTRTRDHGNTAAAAAQEKILRHLSADLDRLDAREREPGPGRGPGNRPARDR